MTKVFKLTPPSQAISGSITIPGSKSYTNRALILSAIASGESVINSPSFSDDSKVLMEALTKLGVTFTKTDSNIKVQGCAGKFLPYKGEINIGAAGTSMRYLTSLCCLVEGGEIILSGSERMHERPINKLVDALKTLGANIEYLGKSGCPPLKIKGREKLKSCKIKLDGNISSQYFTSLLMSAPLLSDGLEIEVVGDQISRSYIDMTFDSLRAFSLEAENLDYKIYRLKGKNLPKACVYQVEGDASGASYFWGLAAIGRGSVRVKNINPKSSQGDARFPEILKSMGCKVTSGTEDGVDWIEVSAGEVLKGTTVDMTLMPDTAQTLAAIAATAEGKTHISGLSTLSIKETDRLQALQNELGKLDIKTDITKDSITVYPGNIGAARIKTYEDHRMAMSFAMLASRFAGIEIEEPDVVSKSFPEFWNFLGQFGIEINKS